MTQHELRVPTKKAIFVFGAVVVIAGACTALYAAAQRVSAADKSAWESVVRGVTEIGDQRRIARTEADVMQLAATAKALVSAGQATDVSTARLVAMGKAPPSMVISHPMKLPVTTLVDQWGGAAVVSPVGDAGAFVITIDDVPSAACATLGKNLRNYFKSIDVHPRGVAPCSASATVTMAFTAS